MLANLMSKVIKHLFEKGHEYRPIVDNVSGIYDIPYDKDGYQKMDVYYPNDILLNKLPVLFNIHGGAWVANDKEINRAYSEYLASFGYCVVNMSYRLLPKTDLKGQVQDVVKAISLFYEMLEANKFAMKIDKDTCVLMGDSAGAHLASLIYCLANEKELNKFFCTEMKALPIKALVLQNMISDLSTFTDSNKLYLKLMVELLFKKPYNKSSIIHRASFLEVINDQIPKVPVILVGSEHDPLYQQTKKMQNYLEENEWQYYPIIWQKKDRKELGHVFQVNFPEWEESKITHQKIFTYLEEVLQHGN